MGKRKSKVEPVAEPDMQEEIFEEAEEIWAEAEPSPPPPGEEKPYILGTWAGRTQWKCKLCPWDTLRGEAAMLQHIATKHAPPKPRILIADKSGRESKK